MRKVKTALFTVLLTLSLALPMTVYAGTWVQTPNGWQVQSDDGNYLINQWYQSPESGLWYYIGADGYMLHDTTTPDGYQVGSDGAWIQTPEPEVKETQPVNNGETNSVMSQEEFDAIEDQVAKDLGLGGEVDPSTQVTISDGISLGPDAGEGYNWH